LTPAKGHKGWPGALKLDEVSKKIGASQRRLAHLNTVQVSDSYTTHGIRAVNAPS
jgi:hypothetical protein